MLRTDGAATVLDRPLKIRLMSGGVLRVLDVVPQSGGFHVTLDDGNTAVVRATTRSDGRVVLEMRGRRLAVFASRPVGSARRQLWIGRRTLEYTVDDPAAASEHAHQDGGLSAAIPSVVLEVLVGPGTQVSAGDRLLLLESMKMVMPVVAARAGRVNAILCEVGDAVDPGTLLVDFTPDGTIDGMTHSAGALP